jgi:hypothetical protein
MKSERFPLNRREFVQEGVKGAGLLAAAAWAARAGAAGKENPFAYDVSRLRKVDPKLIHYEEVRRFRCPHADPRRITVGPDDRVYVAAAKGVGILSAQGEQVGEISPTAPAKCAGASRDGTVYVGLEKHVEVYDRRGRKLAVWESPGKKAWFSGIAVGENAVFVADAGNRVVLRYDPSGKVTGRIGEKNKEREIPGFVVPSPYLDVELAADGLLRVNNPGRHRVEVYTANGDLELFWGKTTGGIEGFCGCCNPVGLAVFPDGRYLTCEKGLPRVKVYSSDGTFESVVAGPESFEENSRAHDLSDCSVGGLDAAVDSRGLVYILDLIVADVRVMKHKGSHGA